MGCNVHDIKNNVAIYDTRRKNLKQLIAYFGMSQNYDKISRSNTKSSKFTLRKNHIYSTVINTKYVVYWATICI
jgi:hypothetical protein